MDAGCALFVKRLPGSSCAENGGAGGGRKVGGLAADIRLAFRAHGIGVTGVKLLKRRRAIVDVAERADSAAVQALVAAGAIAVAGQPCPLILPDNGFILPGSAAAPDERTLELRAACVCPKCALVCRTRRQLAAHLADGAAHRPPPPRWRPERLAEFDLSPHTMVGRMPAAGRAALEDYLGHVAPQWPELGAIVGHVSSHHPTSLRLKELLETLETFRLVGQFIYERHRRQPGAGGGGAAGGAAGGVGGVSEILDLACGHGLLGVLLAYRFPDVPVICVDLEPRACFAHYREAWAAHGVAAPPQPGHGRAPQQPPSPPPASTATPTTTPTTTPATGCALANLSFRQQDVADVPLTARSAVVCVHACNEANLLVLRRCREAGAAAWSVMPCCLPERLYGLNCRHLPDELRYPCLVGTMATQFGAAKVRAIAGAITNRNMCVMGPAAPHAAGGPPVDGAGGRNRTHRTEAAAAGAAAIADSCGRVEQHTAR